MWAANATIHPINNEPVLTAAYPAERTAIEAPIPSIPNKPETADKTVPTRKGFQNKLNMS